jgi:hypothetical protein
VRRTVSVALLVYVALVAAAMALYPGGTYFDPQARGHRFFENFLCDLTRETAHDGERNPGAPLARLSMVVFGVAAAAFTRLLGDRMPSHPARAKAIARLGLVSLVGTAMVALASERDLGTLRHTVVLLVAGVPGLVAVGMGLVGCARERRCVDPGGQRLVLGGGVVALLAATANAALYTAVLAGAGELRALPVVQKIALVCVLGWMAFTAAVAPRAGGRA